MLQYGPMVVKQSSATEWKAALRSRRGRFNGPRAPYFPYRIIGQSGSNPPILSFGKERLNPAFRRHASVDPEPIRKTKLRALLLTSFFLSPSRFPLVHCSWSGERPWPTTPRKRANASFLLLFRCWFSIACCLRTWAFFHCAA